MEVIISKLNHEFLNSFENIVSFVCHYYEFSFFYDSTSDLGADLKYPILSMAAYERNEKKTVPARAADLPLGLSTPNLVRLKTDRARPADEPAKSV